MITILFFIFFFYIIMQIAKHPPWWVRRAGIRTPLGNPRYGEIPDFKHGQPLKNYTLDGLLNTGKYKTVYWDSLKVKTVSKKKELSKLTKHQKTYIQVYKKT